MRPSMSSTARTALVASTTLVLVGCGTDAATPPAGSPAASATASPDTATAEPDADPGHCLHGSWLADNEYFLASIREFGDEVKGVTGEVVLTFGEDGSLTTEYRDWVISAIADGVSVTIRRDGVDTGVYSVDADVLTVEETRIGSTLVMSASGADMTITPAAAAYADAPFDCDAAAAAITTVDGTLQLTR